MLLIPITSHLILLAHAHVRAHSQAIAEAARAMQQQQQPGNSSSNGKQGNGASSASADASGGRQLAEGMATLLTLLSLGSPFMTAYGSICAELDLQW